MLDYPGGYIDAGSGNLLKLHSRCFETCHQQCDALVWSGTCGLCDEQRPLLKHIAKPLGNSFLPSISAEMLTIATCTHVHRTDRASSVNSHSCDCNPGFQETVVDEKRCVEMSRAVHNKNADPDCSGCISVRSCRSAAATCKRSQDLCTSEKSRGELQLSTRRPEGCKKSDFAQEGPALQESRSSLHLQAQGVAAASV